MLIKGILSYPHLFTARAVDANSQPKFGANILLPVGDPQLPAIMAEIEAAKAKGFPTGFPATGKICIGPDDKLQGYYRIVTSAQADQKPAVVNANVQPIIDPSQAFAGVIVFADVRFYSYNKPMNKGVAGGLNGVMITGEIGPLGRIDGRPTVEQMFAGVGGVTGAAIAAAAATATSPPGMPGMPTPPASPVAQPPQYVMTAAAGGATREQMLAAGWTDAQLIQHGMMLPPGGAALPWQPQH